jgi:eukaryotic-like serine/threonine-protein kinase
MVGQSVSHYRILEKLGGGGMGVVYRAHDERLDRDVALKVLPAGLLSDETARSRFRREALTLSQLNHPNIAVVHDFDSDSGVDFLTMEYVVGETLAAKTATGPVPEKEVIALGTQIAEALEEAHEHQIIHRDLKPANVMVTSKGRVKVLDFGLAKLTRPTEADGETASLAESQVGMVMGTVPYMAPEQLQGKQVDARADIYALGGVLYELATGQRPFPEKQSTPLIASILSEAPQPPRELNGQVSASLEAIILKALAKNPDERFQSATEVLEDLGRLGAASTPSAAVGAIHELPLRRRWVVAASASALVAVAALLMAFNVAGLRDRAMMFSEARGGRTAPKIQSLAVLPLENLSGNPQQDYFADGMTEELITTLAQIGSLKVISRTSVMQYKGTRKTTSEIAKELDVDALIEGSVLREGGQVRITAQLIEGSTDKNLWAETYQRDLRSVLALQGEIASAIADKVRAAVTPTERTRLASAQAVDPEAHELYLKGRYYWNKRTPETLKKSLEYFREAVEKDPSYASAYSGLADAYVISGAGNYRVLTPKEAFPKAEAAAMKALELDCTLAEPHASLAWSKMAYDWDWQGAEEEFKQAIELNPNYANAHHWYALFLTVIGKHPQAIAEDEKAASLDPLSLIISSDLGSEALGPAGLYDEEIAQCRKTLEMDPNFAEAHRCVADGYEHKGMYKEAVAELQNAIALSKGNLVYLSSLGYAYSREGRRDETLRILNQLKARSKHEFVAADLFASLYAGLGEKEKALASLEKAYGERDIAMVRLKCGPELDSLRSDPRFQDLLRRMNFPP